LESFDDRIFEKNLGDISTEGKEITEIFFTGIFSKI